MVPKKDLAWWRPRRSAGINFHELPLAVDYLQSSSKIASFIYVELQDGQDAIMGNSANCKLGLMEKTHPDHGNFSVGFLYLYFFIF
jgi:hypothetical protein